MAREYDHCLRCGTTKRDSSHKDQSSPDYHEFQSSKDNDAPKKSARASGMAAQLNKQLDGRRKEPEIGGFADDTDMVRCTYQYPKDGPVNSGMVCGELSTDTIHDKSFGYAGYHAYQPPASSAAGASGD